jgi:predicted ribosomally synthesized peptide with SipW-like signal peptide
MRLRVSIVASIIALLLGAFSIGGATMAWFTAGSDTMENTFTAGTVSFLLGDPNTGTEVDGCLPVNWQIDYTGSKQAYLRVRPVVEAEEIETIYIAIHAILQNGNRILG